MSPLEPSEIPLRLEDDRVVRIHKNYSEGIRQIAAAVKGSEGPPPKDIVDKDQLVREVTERVAQSLGVERQDSASKASTDSSLVFVIMAFDERMELIFQGVAAAASQVGLRAERVKDVVGDFRITDKIIAMIQAARLVVVDLTLERPNVYFELGYARGLGKTVVTIVRQGDEVHFDVKDWNYIPYIDSRTVERELAKRFEYELSR